MAAHVCPANKSMTILLRVLCWRLQFNNKYTGMASSSEDDLEEGIVKSRCGLVTAALKRGANPNAAWERIPPLHLAVIVGEAPVVQALVDAGALMDGRDYLKRTPLHYAAQGLTDRVNSRELINMLLARGATIDARDTIGRTPLDYAVWMHNTDAEAALTAAGASRNPQFESWVAREERAKSASFPERGS